MDTSRSFTVGAAGVAAVAILLGAYSLGQSGAHGSAPVSASPTTTVLPAQAKPGGITVTGTGTVTGTPDVLSLSLGVEVRQPHVTDAIDGTNAAMRKVVDALRAAGVATADVRTDGLSVQADYSYDKGSPLLKGYVANQQVTATLRTVAKAGAIIGAAVDAGGDAARLNGLSLSLEDDSQLLTQARVRAFAEAKTKAEHYASLAGVPLGAVQSVDDQVLSGGQPMYAQPMADRMVASSAVSISPGSQKVAVSVTVVYAIG